MADGKQDYAFVHMTLKIGHGRTLESRQQVGEMLFALIKEHFAALMAQRYGALFHYGRAGSGAELQTEQCPRAVQQGVNKGS